MRYICISEKEGEQGLCAIATNSRKNQNLFERAQKFQAEQTDLAIDIIAA